MSTPRREKACLFLSGQPTTPSWLTQASTLHCLFPISTVEEGYRPIVKIGFASDRGQAVDPKREQPICRVQNRNPAYEKSTPCREKACLFLSPLTTESWLRQASTLHCPFLITMVEEGYRSIVKISFASGRGQTVVSTKGCPICRVQNRNPAYK